jgi:hypothetical protein
VMAQHSRTNVEGNTLWVFSVNFVIRSSKKLIHATGFPIGFIDKVVECHYLVDTFKKFFMTCHGRLSFSRWTRSETILGRQEAAINTKLCKEFRLCIF